MPYNYRLSEEAESDVYDSYLWYEKQKEGLGEDFLNALDAVEQAITDNPTTYRSRYKKKVRAFVVDRFPYQVLYVVNGNDIDVISVFNTNQHPERWKKRVK
ncbi:type II toxin-antitoxin system RelE/ParE family toxin [Echinicola strongylocentroti]|uniref:Type II toxin-antitoxin system RelE/ParE family toxin n=1 Tax=Echinicola strongylocentroti TaxID=1795355 RepID=A0A2Z4IN26_9BACT|nr:type II toxin-antitoxin system RelE/ParE family toxin [Echinicola strongylocentroti]AWW32502.1 type II toxin-antitoxin system RelE/ParE family toxin [Echinicola strongylocentroti]